MKSLESFEKARIWQASELVSNLIRVMPTVGHQGGRTTLGLTLALSQESVNIHIRELDEFFGVKLRQHLITAGMPSKK